MTVIINLINHNWIFFRLDGSTSGTVPLFKGPEGIQISTTELRRIKVDIRRNIPTKGPIPELQRSILNAEEVVLKRREGKILTFSLKFYLISLNFYVLQKLLFSTQGVFPRKTWKTRDFLAVFCRKFRNFLKILLELSKLFKKFCDNFVLILLTILANQ